MSDRGKRATRAIVISDLHLGGAPPTMMSRPALLASFIDSLPPSANDAPGAALELVIAGDFVDFLAIPPHASWTPDPVAARRKLEQTMRQPPFAEVFDALGRHVASGHRLTVLLGNHDVELALPQVQDALLERLEASPEAVRFVADGRAHRIGGLLIEHGNRYDGANVNDWGGLRAIVSALSREEVPEVELQVSTGSRLVQEVVNPFKQRYPFIDLLQPQGELLALLLFAFEPSLRWEWEKIAWLLRGKRLEQRNREGLPPGKTSEVGYSPFDTANPGLSAAFGEVYNQLLHPREEVAAREWGAIAFTPKDDGLAAIFARGGQIGPKRLLQIRTVLRELLMNDTSDRLDGPTGQYGEAARRMIEAGKGIEAVVMGHTHLPRQVKMGERGVYLNTGTWVDRFRVPVAALADNGDQELEAFLRGLAGDVRAPLPPTYGEVLVNAEGRVTAAEVRKVAG